jgi:hypothetical protein
MLCVLVIWDWIAPLFCLAGWWVTVCQWAKAGEGRHNSSEDAATVLGVSTALWVFVWWAISKPVVH